LAARAGSFLLQQQVSVILAVMPGFLARLSTQNNDITTKGVAAKHLKIMIHEAQRKHG